MADRNFILPEGLFHYIISLHSPAKPGSVFSLHATKQKACSVRSAASPGCAGRKPPMCLAEVIDGHQIAGLLYPIPGTAVAAQCVPGAFPALLRRSGCVPQSATDAASRRMQPDHPASHYPASTHPGSRNRRDTRCRPPPPHTGWRRRPDVAALRRAAHRNAESSYRNGEPTHIFRCPDPPSSGRIAGEETWRTPSGKKIFASAPGLLQRVHTRDVLLVEYALLGKKS